MTNKIKLKKEVLEFIDKCSQEVGKHKEEEFNIELWNECQYKEMQSPIEQILYCALKKIQIINDIEDFDIFDHGIFTPGLLIEPQKKIGKYRVDFKITYYPLPTYWNGIKWPEDVGYPHEEKTLIVECDSQQFHERTERERRYEKTRDRYLQSKGYKIFHYTGKEILERPFEIAAEILSELIGRKIFANYE